MERRERQVENKSHSFGYIINTCFILYIIHLIHIVLSGRLRGHSSVTDYAPRYAMHDVAWCGSAFNLQIIFHTHYWDEVA